MVVGFKRFWFLTCFTLMSGCLASPSSATHKSEEAAINQTPKKRWAKAALKSEASHLSTMHRDILLDLSKQHLSAVDTVNLSKTCKYLNQILNDNDLWKFFYYSDEAKGPLSYNDDVVSWKTLYGATYTLKKQILNFPNLEINFREIISLLSTALKKDAGFSYYVQGVHEATKNSLADKKINRRQREYPFTDVNSFKLYKTAATKGFKPAQTMVNASVVDDISKGKEPQKNHQTDFKNLFNIEYLKEHKNISPDGLKKMLLTDAIKQNDRLRSDLFKALTDDNFLSSNIEPKVVADFLLNAALDKDLVAHEHFVKSLSESNCKLVRQNKDKYDYLLKLEAANYYPPTGDLIDDLLCYKLVTQKDRLDHILLRAIAGHHIAQCYLISTKLNGSKNFNITKDKTSARILYFGFMLLNPLLDIEARMDPTWDPIDVSNSLWNKLF